MRNENGSCIIFAGIKRCITFVEENESSDLKDESNTDGGFSHSIPTNPE
jgi:hypothetical protein